MFKPAIFLVLRIQKSPFCKKGYILKIIFHLFKFFLLILPDDVETSDLFTDHRD